MYKSFTPPLELRVFINAYDKFIVAGHEEPDADCVGSGLALASMLRRLGKTALPCSAGPFRKAEVIPYKDLFSARVDEAARKDAVVIIVDCQSLSRTGSLEGSLKGLPLAVIDHHAAAPGGGKADCSYIEASAASATVLIFSLFDALGLPLTREEAGLLFLGLCTDTGFFRHIDSGGEDVFHTAAALAAAGASPKNTFAKINGGRTLNSRLLLGTVLCHTESYFGGKLLFTSEELAETELYGIENRDSDMLYQLLMSVEGVEAAAVIRQSSPTQCAIGLRSRDSVDVAKIASAFGGGGHKNAAGAYLDGSIPGLKQALISEFKKVFPG
ncbi:MAG: bifunctional oligoribonuclease/PAP phosphatase NrnA [Spirochaetaceae bacterium]|jgi:phosphoesterase RecJ-like protein|nr:bifunctional oligoribonuclease/PAP phosphatase NrnA [Spirochaetaceae bacterium]